MNSDQKILLKLLDGKNIFQLPVYQRNYNWESKHVERFLDDIESILNGREQHFFGVFIGIEKTSSFVDRKTLIDGQQRLTTTMLFLKALHDAILEKNYDDDAEQQKNHKLAHDIMSSYLTNNLEGRDRVKLQLLGVDRENYIRLLEDPKLCDPDSRIRQNYSECKKRITHWIGWDQKTPREIFDTLAKIQVIYLRLLEGEDDPQLIFESINSTGLDLAKSDLIRNFLLMGILNLEEQERLFKNYWLKISDENLHRNNDVLERFFTHYVMYKTESAGVKAENLYEKFKSLCENRTHEEILIELEKFSKYFEAFVFFEGKYSDGVFKHLKSLSQLNQTACFPFLLHVFDDFANQIIDESTLEEVLKLVVIYHVQCMVCETPSKSRPNFFATLYRRVFQIESNRTKYVESIKKFMCKASTKDKMPSEKEFSEAFEKLQLFLNKALGKFLFEDILGKKIDGLKLIMILPDTFSKDWGMSQDDQELYKYRLGNLTLARHDSKKASFAQKRKMLRDDDTIDLNFDVVNKNVWGVAEIEERNERLKKILLKHFNIDRNFDPQILLEDQSIEPVEIAIEDWKIVSNRQLLGYKFQGKSHETGSWQKMLEEILATLDEKYSADLELIADIDGKYPKLTRNFSEDLFEIHPNLYAKTDLTPQLVLLSLQSLFQNLKISPTSISFVVSEK